MSSLIVDSVLSSRNEQLIHCMNQSGVFTATTSIIMTTLHKIQKMTDDKGDTSHFKLNTNDDKFHGKSNTTAWSCITVGSGANLTGAVVSGDPSLGHILIARFQLDQWKWWISLLRNTFIALIP